jgi:hypothetical protein
MVKFGIIDIFNSNVIDVLIRKKRLRLVYRLPNNEIEKEIRDCHPESKNH